MILEYYKIMPYKPNGAVTLAEQTTRPQIRLGIQSAPKCGKTWAATTFPNPLFINLDRGLGAHAGKSNIVELPFYNTEWTRANAKSSFIKEALEIWIDNEGQKLEADQTLIIDGGTGLENAFDIWSAANPQYARSGKIDEFAHWRLKKDFFKEFFEKLKSLKCDVIYITHEIPDRDDKGNLNGKLRPLHTGQFADQLASHLTDYFRQHAVNKPTDYSTIDHNKLALWGCSSVTEFKSIVDSFVDTNSIFFWETQPSDVCNCGTSTLVNPPRFIPAHYEAFLKYTRKIETPKN